MRQRFLVSILAAAALSVTVTLAVAVAARNRPPAEPRPPDDQLWIAPGRFAAGEARLATVREAALPQPLVLGGRLDFDDLRIAHVFSSVSGRVTRILARLGQEVGPGTPLAAMASPDMGSALADEVKARADLAAATREWLRQQRLLAVQAAAQRDFEAADDNHRRAEAEEERALARLRLLRRGTVDAVTQEYTLPSPIAGRVLARMVSPGSEVQGQFSGGVAAELFTIGSADTLWLYADVGEADLPAVRPGTAVKARVLAYPDRELAARVDWVSPVLDPQLRTARVRCVLPNPGRLLKPQMFASVVVERPALRGLAVPRAAVVRIHDQSFVYVATGARRGDSLVFQRRRVETPARAGAVSRDLPPAAAQALLPVEPAGALAQLVQVLSGLNAGEQVLVDGLAARDARGTCDSEGGDGTGCAGGMDAQAGDRDQTVAVTAAQLRGGQIALAPVDDRPVPGLLDLGGRLAFDDLRVAHVFPPVGGRITRVLAAPGQRVEKGAPLAVIESPELGSAFSDMLKARADLAAAAHEAQRQRELTALGVGVPRDLEGAEDGLARARAEADRAEQRTRLLQGGGAAGALSQALVLRSPIAGEVTARLAAPGLEVQGQYDGGGNVVELFTVGQADPLWLLGEIFEMDLPYVRVGDAVALQVAAFPGRTFRGTIDWIADALDPVQRTARVRCVLANPEHLLRPEMYGTARLAPQAPLEPLQPLKPLQVAARRGLSVPREALLRLGGDTVVFVAAGATPDGRWIFRRRPVVAREELPGSRVPILAGLQPGERVAARGAIFLAGMR